MTHAARVSGVVLPVADLLGYDFAERTRYGLLLTARVAGTSVIPPEPDPERLRAVGAVAARINSIQLAPAPALPVRSRPIEGEDFAGMRREQGASDLLRAAEAVVAATRPDDGWVGLVHGDLWYGNMLWDDGGLTAVLDWDCAWLGRGLALTSARCAATRPGATVSTPPSTSCADGKPKLAGPPATFPTGMPSPRSPPRRTWAGSRHRWPPKAAPI